MNDNDTRNLHGKDDKGTPFTISLYDDCPTCHGSGRDPQTEVGTPCRACKGKGRLPNLNGHNIVHLLKEMGYPEPPDIPLEVGGLKRVG